MDSQGTYQIIEEFVSRCIKIVIIVAISAALLGGVLTYSIIKNVNKQEAQKESKYDNR